MKLEVFENAAPEDIAAVREGLVAHNRLHLGADGPHKLVVIVRREGEVVAGLCGSTWGEWMEVDQVWVDESTRGEGLGRRVMEAAEAEAILRGCTRGMLDTFSFQAPEFYKKLGYVVFGVIEDYIPGERQYFMEKRLPDPL